MQWKFLLSYIYLQTFVLKSPLNHMGFLQIIETGIEYFFHRTTDRPTDKAIYRSSQMKLKIYYCISVSFLTVLVKRSS